MARILEDIFPNGLSLSDLPTMASLPRLSPEAQLRVAMAEVGIQAPDHLEFDGRFHRFATGAKKSNKSGWYIAFDSANIPAGAFGDWRQGIESTWRADIGRELSHIEQMQHASRMRDLKAIREKEIAVAREDAAEKAAGMWEAAPLASDDHPYLTAKGITNPGLRAAPDGRLLAPMYHDGDLVSLQQIAPDGQKLFLKGGKSGGAWWHIGGALNQDCQRVYIAEGVATAASIFEATGKPVAIGYSATNLAATAQAVRAIVGLRCEIVVVADNDASGTGQREGPKAAEACGGRCVVIPTDGMDANDYAQAGGDLMALLEPPPAPDQESYLTDADDFAAQQKPIQWLIKRWIPRHGLIMIHGPSGGGKTFALIDMLCRIAAGLPTWGDERLVKVAPVVYLAGEGHQGLRGRIAGWKMANAVESFQGRLFISRAGVDLNTPDGYQTVRNAILSLPIPPAAIAVDTLHRFLAGDENSAQDTKTMLDACAGLMREFDCSVILVHHTGVNEEAQHRARGSSAWRGALDIEISVLPAGNGQLQLIQRKSKDAELAPDLKVKLVSQPLGWVDEDGEEVNTAVAHFAGAAVDADGPELPPDEPKGLKIRREAFESAVAKFGVIVGDQASGEIYISATGLVDFWNDLDFSSDANRRANLSKTKRALLDAHYIEERGGRYFLANEEAFPTLRMKVVQASNQASQGG
jgi:putative DNA primase/helicase